MSRWRGLYATASVLFLQLCILLSLVHVSFQASWLGERSLAELSSPALQALVSDLDPTKNLDTTNPSSHLSKILIPRPPDTENNTLVKDYIVSTLKALKWDVEEDTFTDNTPYGVKRFTNVIATKDPAAARRIVLSAHFDSKFFPNYPESQFVGATDSAVPCAMMLDLAEALNPLLDHRSKQHEEGLLEDDDVAETTLQLVFFDGEEALKDWTATDSIYGARHLAQKWATTYIQPHSKRRMLPMQTNEIQTIEHLVLLDLLGAPDPFIRPFFKETAWLFDALVSAEARLRESDLLLTQEVKEWKSFFFDRKNSANGNIYQGYIEDDHIPFLHQGVDILHVISSPFPKVWHSLKDDASALHLPTMRRWNLILRVFFSEYLGLKPEEVAHSRAARASDELTSAIEIENV